MAKENQAGQAQTVQTIEVVETNLITLPRQEAKQMIFPEGKKTELIQAFINAEVVNFGYSRESTEQLIKTTSKLKVKDQEDEEGYKKVKEAYNKLVKIRTGSDAERKEIGKPYDLIKKGVNDYCNTEILAVAAPEEARLKVEKDKYEKWEAEKKAREEAEAKKKLEDRVTELKTAGLVFDGEMYVLENISMDLISIGKMSDSNYMAFLGKVKAEKKRVDDAEAERLEKEAEERQKIKDQQEENERKAKELRDEVLEVRRDKLLDAGFTDDPEKERFYVFADGLVEITYNEAAAKKREDFTQYLSEIKELLTKKAEPFKDYSDIENTTPVYDSYNSEHELSQEALISNLDDLAADLPSIRAYINSVLKMPLPKCKNNLSNDILAAFKKGIVEAAHDVIKQVDPNGNNSGLWFL